MKSTKRSRKNDAPNELTSNELTSSPVLDAPIRVKAADAGEWLPAETLKAEFVRAVVDGKSITVDLDSLTHLDAGALQVLLAAELELKRSSKSLTLENVSDDLKAWLGYAGASFHCAEGADGLR